LIILAVLVPSLARTQTKESKAPKANPITATSVTKRGKQAVALSKRKDKVQAIRAASNRLARSRGPSGGGPQGISEENARFAVFGRDMGLMTYSAGRAAATRHNAV